VKNLIEVRVDLQRLSILVDQTLNSGLMLSWSLTALYEFFDYCDIVDDLIAELFLLLYFLRYCVFVLLKRLHIAS
jgi:hypothetical protein